MSYGGGAKCFVCTKAVYAADPKVQADGKNWHAACFTCKECKSQITLAKWAQLEGENFCKPCFKKVFMLRGKYSDVAASGKEAAAEPAAAAAAPSAAAAAAAAATAAAAAAAAAAPKPAKAGAWVPKTPAAGEGGSAAAAESKYGGGKKCAACTKAVYSADPKVEADGKVWHSTCFKCEECKGHITLAKWAQLEGRNFCTTCFAKIFSLRGKYDDIKEGVHKAAGGGGEASSAAAAPEAAVPAAAAAAAVATTAAAAAAPEAAEPAAAAAAAPTEAAAEAEVKAEKEEEEAAPAAEGAE